MTLPNQLLQSFDEIKQCDLVLGFISKTNVHNFVNLLNRAIPSSLNPIAFTIYRFNRSMYLRDKKKFIEYIKDFDKFQAMILWTDFNDILEYFNLVGKIFLGWDKSRNQYRAFIVQSKESNYSDTQDSRNNQHIDESKSDSESKPNSVPVKPEDINELDNELDRVYAHMAERMIKIGQEMYNQESK